jgi:hypothetical protein
MKLCNIWNFAKLLWMASVPARALTSGDAAWSPLLPPASDAAPSAPAACCTRPMRVMFSSALLLHTAPSLFETWQ